MPIAFALNEAHMKTVKERIYDMEFRPWEQTFALGPGTAFYAVEGAVRKPVINTRLLIHMQQRMLLALNAGARWEIR